MYIYIYIYIIYIYIYYIGMYNISICYKETKIILQKGTMLKNIKP